MSDFNSKEFKKTRAEWYKKLADSGFEDAETMNGKLKISARQVLRSTVAATKQSKEAYFTLADSFLHEHTFETELSKVVWEYHVNGLGSTAIALILIDAGIKTNRTTILAMIKQLKAIMKLKYLKVD